jgi:putative transposase
VCLFVDAGKATGDNPDGYGVARLCRVPGINRSTCYGWLGSRPDAVERQCAQDESAGRIRAVHVTSRGACGAPRVHAELRRTGCSVNRKKAERIMRERGIRGITRRERRRLTKQDTR